MPQNISVVKIYTHRIAIMSPLCEVTSAGKEGTTAQRELSGIRVKNGNENPLLAIYESYSYFNHHDQSPKKSHEDVDVQSRPHSCLHEE